MAEAPKGHCWLCNKFGKLTKEHIPPESAFNDCPLLMLKIDERSPELTWVPQQPFSSGIHFRSLCESCNNRFGSIYGDAYVQFVRKVAERIGDIRDFHKVSLQGVKYPLRILKQILLQFVTANGQGFVQANPWVAPFIRNKENQEIPNDVAIYVFASNRRGARKSGVSAHVELPTRAERVLAEFSFWPLGTVLSWGELSDPRLTPVHHWVQHRFDTTSTVDLELSVNPIASSYPVDFRSEEQMIKERTAESQFNPYSEEASRGLIKRAIEKSGTDDSNWVFSGHPNTVNKILSQK